MITVFFRYDDYSALSPEPVDAGLIQVLRRRGVSATFSVVPSVTTGEVHVPGDRPERLLEGPRMERLAQAVTEGVVDLALHGWNHRTHAGALPPDPSEFRGVPYEDQLRRLECGQHLLEAGTGRRPRTFVPPWNTYDRATLRALEELGFECIAANREGPRARVGSTLQFAPMTVEMPALREAVERARTTGDGAAVISVMLHPYDFAEDPSSRAEMTLADFDAELRWLQGHPDVRIAALSDLLDAGLLDGRRYRANAVSGIEDALPQRVERTNQNPVYHSTHPAAQLRRRRMVIATVAHGAIVVVAALAALTMAAFSLERFVLLGLGATALLLTLLVVRAVRFRAIYFKGMAMVSALTGALAGFLVVLQ